MSGISLTKLAQAAYDHAKFCINEAGQVDPMVFWANKQITMFPLPPYTAKTKDEVERLMREHFRSVQAKCFVVAYECYAVDTEKWTDRSARIRDIPGRVHQLFIAGADRHRKRLAWSAAIDGVDLGDLKELGPATDGDFMDVLAYPAPSPHSC